LNLFDKASNQNLMIVSCYIWGNIKSIRIEYIQEINESTTFIVT